MFTAYIVVTVLAAGANTYAAVVDFARVEWVVANMTELRIPQSQLFPLGAVKAAGALGLLLGFAVPPIGLAAAIGLVLYFVGAVATVVRARCWNQIPYPTVFLLLATGALALHLAAA